jgi:phospholipid/cholesterol/gamma-HCH transport system permease protein
MVGSAVNRAFLPAKSLFEVVGDMMILTARTLVSAVRPPYPYGEEFIGQFLFALQLCWFPLLVSTVAFGFGATSSRCSAPSTGSAASSCSPRFASSRRS